MADSTKKPEDGYNQSLYNELESVAVKAKIRHLDRLNKITAVQLGLIKKQPSPADEIIDNR